MRALVVTVVHHPEDSRIRFREVAALLKAGWQVTYAAPFTAYGVTRNSHEHLATLDIPRAQGRRRFRALRAARAVLRRHGPAHDVVLLHDPELLAAALGLRLPPVVWDVHEDTAAAVTLKPWLPRALRRFVRSAFRRVEQFAERRCHLILAEYGYQTRFSRPHLVVPNVNRVPDAIPPPNEPHVVYVGSLTHARGAVELVELARLVAAKTDGALTLRLIGPASGDIETLIRAAASERVLEWLGFLPAERAMEQIRGAVAGLSLLRDEPNYRVSLPTKVVEYMANGVPVVTTPLPLARDIVEEVDCGVVVPFQDAAAAADAVLELWSNPQRRLMMGAAGHQAAKERFNWSVHEATFVAELSRVASSASSRRWAQSAS